MMISRNAMNLALVIGLLGLPAPWIYGDDPPRIHQGPFSQGQLLTGELVAEDAVELIVPNAGIYPIRIRWLVEDGAEVSAGDRIVDFDNSQLVSTMETAESEVVRQANELTSVRSNAADAEYNAAYEVAKRQAELSKARLKAEVPANLRSKQEYELDQLNLRKARLGLTEAENVLTARRKAEAAAVEIQRIAFEKAGEQFHRAQENLRLLELEAPRAGIVLVAENRSEGRTFQAGDDTFPGRLIARLPNLATLIVEARLFDVDDGKITPGQSVVAVLDTFPDMEWTGKIREIDNIASEASRRSTRRSFRVLVDIDEPDTERMLPGMSVKIRVDTGSSEQVLIPRSSLVWQDRQPKAHLADGRSVEIALGPCNAAVCVVENGPPIGTALATGSSGQ